MSFIEKSGKENGTPRARETYRGYKRNNIISWKGVETDRVKQHPPLIKNEKGQVNFSVKKKKQVQE